MKQIAILVSVLLIAFLSGCTTETQTNMPAPPTSEGLEKMVLSDSDRELLENIEEVVDKQDEVDCTTVVNHNILLDALPKTVDSYSMVGDAYSDTSEILGVEGAMSSNAAITLTENDEAYIDFLAVDECGFNMNDIAYAVKVEDNNEYGWTKDIQINNRPAKLEYDSGAGFYTVSVFLNERTLITTNGQGVSEAFTIKAAERVDYASIESAYTN